MGDKIQGVECERRKQREQEMPCDFHGSNKIAILEKEIRKKLTLELMKRNFEEKLNVKTMP